MAIPIGDSEDQKFKGLFSQTNLDRGIHMFFPVVTRKWISCCNWHGMGDDPHEIEENNSVPDPSAVTFGPTVIGPNSQEFDPFFGDPI